MNLNAKEKDSEEILEEKEKTQEKKIFIYVEKELDVLLWIWAEMEKKQVWAKAELVEKTVDE